MARSKSTFSIAALLLNIWREPLLRTILIISLVIALGLPLFNRFFLVPEFTRQLTQNVEDEARRSAEYMLKTVFPNARLQRSEWNHADIDAKVRLAQESLLLDKVKVFAPDGRVIYSTDHQEIGEVNQKSYFQTVVRQGNIYSKLVSKDSQTGEGRISSKDVSEVYIPVMNAGQFTGAFEIYYDVTTRKADLERLAAVSSLLSFSLSGLLFLLILLVVGRASRVGLKRKAAETALCELNNSLAERLREQTYEIEVTQKTSIEALAVLAESYDADTGAHLERIQRYVQCLAAALQEDSSYSVYLDGKNDYVAELTLASLLHDIGKTAVPKEILSKRGKLSEAEFAVVKKHTEIAGSILGRANQAFAEYFGKDSYLALARDIALHHHERWDGQGYPHHLREKEIPLSARIVSIADVYDALRSQRPYKSAWSHEEAVAEIIRCRGSQFDPELVDLFVSYAERFAEIAEQTLSGEERVSFSFQFSPKILTSASP